MAQNRECKKCSQYVDGRVDLFTVCEGDCARMFHINCVGLKEEDLQFILSRPQNIAWMCNACMDGFRKKREDIRPDPAVELTTKATTIEHEVTELKNTVAAILDTLAKIDPASSPTATEVLHSTPNTSYTLLNGTNVDGRDGTIPRNGCEANASNDDSLPRSRNTTHNDSFSLFLSNIDPCVSELDVHRMVSQALGTPEPERIDVIKLTKNWNDARTLDFVSFKVALERKWKSRALDPSIWPVNIKFREFINRHNNTWRPSL